MSSTEAMASFASQPPSLPSSLQGPVTNKEEHGSSEAIHRTLSLTQPPRDVHGVAWVLVGKYMPHV